MTGPKSLAQAIADFRRVVLDRLTEEQKSSWSSGELPAHVPVRHGLIVIYYKPVLIAVLGFCKISKATLEVVIFFGSSKVRFLQVRGVEALLERRPDLEGPADGDVKSLDNMSDEDKRELILRMHEELMRPIILQRKSRKK